MPYPERPSPLWVPIRGEKPADWQERLLAHLCAAGAGEMLIELERRDRGAANARDLYLRGALIAIRSSA
jgi:hypothetical protein